MFLCEAALGKQNVIQADDSSLTKPPKGHTPPVLFAIKNVTTKILFHRTVAFSSSKPHAPFVHILKTQYLQFFLAWLTAGFDSVLALGSTEPDPKKDKTMKIDGHTVTIPQGKPIKNPALKGSTSFSQSEYLLYKEGQVRIRYVLRMKWGN
jgi:hypothetical protein